MNDTYEIARIVKRGSVNTRVILTSGENLLIPTAELTGNIHQPAEDTTHQLFTTAQRYKFLKQQVEMVATGIATSLYVLGAGGLGKSFTVEQKLQQMDADYIIMKGFTTPKGLFDFCKENNGRTILLDDCDDAFKDPKGKNILKALTELSGKRYVSWNTSRDADSGYYFTGQIIFISNVPPSSLDGALVSRALMADISMNTAERLEFLEIIAPDLGFDEAVVTKALNFLKANADRAKAINARSLIKVAKAFEFSDDTDLALFILMSTPE